MSLKQLEIHRDIVALEAFSVNNVTGLLKDIFPATKDAFVDFIGSFRRDVAVIALAPSHKKFEQEMSKHTYMDIKELLAFTPEGLNTDFREYADYLLAAAKHSSKVLELVSEFNVYLAKLISNNDIRLSTDDKAARLQGVEDDRKLLLQDIGGCFDKGSTRTETNIGKVVKRNSDWQDIFNICEDMTKLITSVDRNKLNHAVDDCVEMIESLERKIKNSDMEGVSSNAVNNLSMGTYQVACELEFYATNFYRIEAFIGSINRTMSHFETTMKQ